MEMWACSPLGQHVDFICVCVDDDKRVAFTFERMFKFTKVINGVVMSRKDMPTFGQLGCSGFIVIGADGVCVSRKTSAFLAFGEKAFRTAESVIMTALEDADVELNAVTEESAKEKHLYANGQVLRLEGISSDLSLNGRLVTVINFETTKGRFNVSLNDDSNRRICVMPCCLAPITAEERITLEYEAVTEIQPPNLVGCKAVDDEHFECTTAINECLRACTRENLASLLVCLEQHFEHEETLASTSGFGTVSDSFSPMFSHAKDHARILQLARAELERTAKNPSDVNVGVARMIAASFLEHAKVFDSLLEGNLQNE